MLDTTILVEVTTVIETIARTTSNRMTDITITTTDTLDGQTVSDYLGVVSGEAVIGANVVSDMAAGIRNVVGGRADPTRRK